MTQILALIGTGLSLGVVHVLTGPDHLSAIATLSVNVPATNAFWLGVRWGLGHSTGLLLVGCCLLLLTSSTNAHGSKDGEDNGMITVPAHVSNAFEGLVGIFMLLLGIYGMHQAWEKRQGLEDYRTLAFVLEEEDDGGHDNGLVVEKSDAVIDEEQQQQQQHGQAITNENSLVILSDPTSSMQEVSDSTIIVQINSDDSNSSNAHCLGRCCQTLSLRTMAMAAGIVHGLAGPGGVLGVIPAVQLHNARLASIYLATFCATSTVTMGIFAMVYGTCSFGLGQGLGPRQVFLQALSASLSIAVGILWLALLACGKLEEVFP